MTNRSVPSPTQYRVRSVRGKLCQQKFSVWKKLIWFHSKSRRFNSFQEPLWKLFIVFALDLRCFARQREKIWFSEPYKRFLAVSEALLQFVSYITAYYYLLSIIHTENCCFVNFFSSPFSMLIVILMETTFVIGSSFLFCAQLNCIGTSSFPYPRTFETHTSQKLDLTNGIVCYIL